MCEINPQQWELQSRLLLAAADIFSKLIESELGANSPNSTDVLGAATTAYQQGKITKSQFMAVIDALDEQVYHTRAYVVPNAYLAWHKNQYRR